MLNRNLHSAAAPTTALDTQNRAPRPSPLPSAAPGASAPAADAMDIRILGVETVDDYTAYVLQVSKGDKVWTVKHRYSTFDDLRKVATRELGNLAQPFPGKHPHREISHQSWNHHLDRRRGRRSLGQAGPARQSFSSRIRA